MLFLSFDIEEFDNPLPYTKRLNFEQQMAISVEGTIRILDLLAEKGVKATFFCTANFALNAKPVIERMVSDGHEVASHGYYHDQFEAGHLRESKEVLEAITAVPVVGFRMPNMASVDMKGLKEAGYQYDSSLNPTFLPGKYYNFHKPRRLFVDQGIWEIPASVSARLRIPLFWLTLHNFPLRSYFRLCRGALRRDGYLNLYFHPWEFVDLTGPEVDLPFYITRNSGEQLVNRLGGLIEHFKQKAISFGVLRDCPSTFAR